MRILVVGAAGMLGHKVVQRLVRTHSVAAVLRRLPPGAAPFLDGAEIFAGVDVRDEPALEAAMDAFAPEVVVNAVGVIKQLQVDTATQIAVNALFPHRLAALCGRRGARLVSFSTDCVFSGRRGGYRETDTADAEDVYGRTKWLGEVGGPGCITLRTSLIGRCPWSPVGLVEWFLAQRGPVKGYRRAVFSGLTTAVAAEVVERVVRDHPALEGVWQVASAPIAKLDLLQLLAQAFGSAIAIESDDGVAIDRSLDGSRFLEATGIAIPAWPDMVRELAADDAAYERS
ncbi:sugar nucleotide-binding protein [Arenibaculum pallidiluteum]|uniref:sugar nucleotide-binding protein n=1 Tax=Arenibaculum pallidiluteum TaxID=2812559 RepID=UPI001A978874|nr:sugar nucleotide-binding protein [Arenibaculum pallidiluteum]